MDKRIAGLLFFVVARLSPLVGQPATLLPQKVIEGLGNTVSGSRPLQVLHDIAA